MRWADGGHCSPTLEGHPIPTKMRRWPNAGLMLARRRRRRANITPTLGQRLMFAGSMLMNFK